MSQPFRDATNKASVSSLMKSMNELSFNAGKPPGSASRRPFGVSNQSQTTFNAGNAARKGLKKRELTPTRNGSYMNTSGVQGDRFVGVRRTDIELDLANHHLAYQQSEDSTFNTSNSAPNSPCKPPTQKEQLKQMMRVKSTGNLTLTDAGEDDRILVYKKSSAPAPPVGHMNQAKVLYSASALQPSSSVKKSSRFIPSNPERILDAPELQDDYYINVLDWNCNGIVAVALGFAVYLWNADTGDTQVLFENDGNNELEQPTTLKWAKDGLHLGVGFKDGTVKIYDPSRTVPANGKLELRSMKVPRQCKSGVMAWKGAVISAGYQTGQIIHHDVRVAQHIVGSFNGHDREVLGLHYSHDETLLASGSADTTVKVWNTANLGGESSSSIYSLEEHLGSVRAVQFSNFKSRLLATGGGMTDKTVKLWNANSGQMTKSIETDSAVNSIVFNKDYHEMMTAHGSGHLNIWKYPTYASVASLTAHHPLRALSLCSSPCGQFIMSSGADETLRMWHAFKIDKSTSMLAQRSKLMGMSIR